MYRKMKWMDWQLNVDIENTKKWYSMHHNLCCCDDCQYYMDYVGGNIEILLMDIWGRFAINPTMPCFLEPIDNKDLLEKGLRQYYGCYYLVGEVIDGAYCVDIEESGENTVQIDYFIFGFEEMLVHDDDFPYPLLQLEFKATIPAK